MGRKVHIHVTKDGQEIPVTKMTDSHLLNTIKYIERKAKEGMEVICGGSGSYAEDMWADVETLYGEDVFDRWDFEEYAKEAKRRKLNYGKD